MAAGFYFAMISHASVSRSEEGIPVSIKLQLF